MSKLSEAQFSELRDFTQAIRDNILCQERLIDKLIAFLDSCESGQSSLPTDLEQAAACWQPEVRAAFLEFLPTLKVRKIERINSEPDDLARLKESVIGRFYSKYLKRFSLMRKISFWVWVNFYPIFSNIAAIQNTSSAKRWRPMVKLADYVSGSNVPTTSILDATKVDTPPPKVFPAEDQVYLLSPHSHYEYPSIYVAQLSDALIYGGTNLVFKKDAVICHDLYDFARDYTGEELHGRHVIDAKKKRLRLVRNGAISAYMPVAAAFLDACAPNYAHWLTEVLPRIAVFCSIEEHASVPVIVNDDLHPNIMESLALVAGGDREVIALPVGEAISVGVLYVTSVTGYVPFGRRNAKLDEHSHGLFCPLSFDQVNKRLLPIVDKLPLQNFPSKVYLRRKSGVRKITNDTEIEQILSGNGYVIIEPERLTFLQQVKLFQAADEVIAPTGAALANAIFCRPGTRVGVLMGKHEQMIYRYWLDMLAPLGIRVSYVLGSLADNLEVGVHADFHVDAEHLHELLSDWRSA